jgi:potassium-transporting ATPase KdpC subunit
MRRQLRIALIFLGLFTLITGIIYPLVVTGIAQVLFYHQANGSLIEKEGENIGSELIGQPFDEPRYFWGRLSATTPFPYNSMASSGSNYGPLNPKLREEIQNRINELQSFDPDNNQPIPIDLVTSSASGLDPDISIAAALYQVPRVAKYRKLSVEKITVLVNSNIEDRQFGILGEPRVNVLKLNLTLDAIQ